MRTVTIWSSWQQSQQKTWKRFGEGIMNAVSFLELWKRSLLEIEGKFGKGIQSYFTFLRSLVVFNLIALALIVGFVLVPSTIVSWRGITGNSTDNLTYYDNCGKCLIFNKTSSDDGILYSNSLSLLSGSGFMENTTFFYGFYNLNQLNGFWYNIPLAYLLSVLCYFLLCLIWVVKRLVGALMHKRMQNRHYKTSFSIKVFAGWDFCILEPTATSHKQHNISYNLRLDLERECRLIRKLGLTLKDKLSIYFVRLLINLVILSLLTGAFFCIFQATQTSHYIGQKAVSESMTFLKEFVIQYLPSIVIKVIDFILPEIFQILVKFEGYSPTTQMNITLMRIVFLKLASLGMFFFSLWQQITCSGNQNHHDCKSCGYNQAYKCWETRIGQEMYRLMVFDFISCIVITFLIQLPRKLLVTRYSWKILKLIKQERFLISFNVLDIIYGQTVIWIGIFYSPLLPLLNTIKFFIFFYIKKFSLYHNCRVEKRIIRVSSTNVFFQFVLLLGLILALASLTINIALIPPSRTCGPFQKYSSVWEVVTRGISTLPPTASSVLKYMGSKAFAFPLLIALCLLLTHYVSLMHANKKAIEQLKHNLVMLSGDKQFLVRQIDLLSKEPSP
uniref:Transmembrane channel-like protein n=1 Tax=Latimeria chalumnae TaxID=7897 RepID=H3B868_LATCH